MLMSQPDKVIAVCPSCEAKLAVPATAVGKKIRCPKCQTVVAITAAMVSPAVPTGSEPSNAAEVSLGVENTFTGPAKKNAAPESLGDEATFGGRRSVDDAVIDDDMEIVDLSARYTIEGVLGKGGMGEVRLATDSRLGRKVAIKRILGDTGKSQTAVNRFLTEAKSIAALSHPNIVQIYDYGRDKHGPFLILEYVEGKNLLERCQQKALALEEAVELTCQLCDGLGKAHDAGIIHRDLKPANVLLTKDGVPKLTDFGLARVESGDTGHTMSGAVLGTLDFMPPEQRRDATQADARSDLWSLAATLYQMVTGKSPKIIRFNDVPSALQKVLGKALEDDKADRYQTAREFKEALRASLQDTSPAIANLGEGQCVNCSTKNDSVRKFCRECAVSLRVPCLSCGAEIPVWDKVCGTCGTKQAVLLEERRTAMSAQQSQAESLLKNYEFDQATTLAVTLRDEPDPRLQQLNSWSRQFLEDVESGRKQQQERIGTLLSEALQHEHAYDYPSGIHTLEQVPEILRGTSVPGQTLTPETLLKRLNEKQSEVHRLDGLIRQRVKSRQLNGLQVEIDSLLKLCPNRADLAKLTQQLAARDVKLMQTRDEAFLVAQERLRNQDYAGAIEELDRIDRQVMLPNITAFRNKAEALQTRLQTLQKFIAEAVERKQLHGLLKSVEECLALKAGDVKLEQLRHRLLKREDKNASQIRSIVERAETLRDTCQFAAAKQALKRIPQEQQSQEVLDLMADCDAMSTQRALALAALENHVQSGNDEKDSKRAEVYRKSIDKADLTDSEFETQYQAYQQALDAEREATASAVRQRKLLIKIGITAAALVPLLMLGLLIRSSMQAAAEKREADLAAMKKSEEVLAIPPIRNTIGVELKLIPAGTFTMGSASNDSDEQPHVVTLTRPFYIGVHEVTWEQYERVMGINPSNLRSAQNPVEAVSWDDAVSYCAKLSDLPAEKAAGRVYRLPTEAEWEYACRAETMTAYSFGNDESQLNFYAWHSKNSSSTTHPVGQKKPNAWGLYDMHGNVWEWCSDWHEAYPRGAVTDPQGPLSGSSRVLRGGSWFFDEAGCRTAERLTHRPSYRTTDNGFRVVLTSPETAVSADFSSTHAAAEKREDVLAIAPIRNSIAMALNLIPAGTFTMGSTFGDADEQPHTVTLTRPFYMGAYEVTQEQYVRVMGSHQSTFEGPDNPVQVVSWDDAVAFCQKLSDLPVEKAAGRVYRLPTEAEWEYACRAGTTTAYSFGDNTYLLGYFAWYDNNSSLQPHAVGQKKPNAWGLHDMHGNVWEWCSDWHEAYPVRELIDPQGPYSGLRRVSRGGSYMSVPENCRSAYRNMHAEDNRALNLGFRVALTSPETVLGAATPTGFWTDLLNSPNITRHTICGEWKQNGTGITTIASRGSHAAIQMLSLNASSFEVEIDFEYSNPRREPSPGLILSLPVRESRCFISFWEPDWCQLANVRMYRDGRIGNGKFNNGTPVNVPLNERCVLNVKLRQNESRSSLLYSLNGAIVLDWTGDANDLSEPQDDPPNFWQYRQPKGIALGVVESNVKFHSVKFRPL